MNTALNFAVSPMLLFAFVTYTVTSNSYHLITPISHLIRGSETCAEAVSFREQVFNCAVETSATFDNATTLRYLYGDHFSTDRNRTEGRGSVLIFANHNSGTSILARLFMLFGAFQGNLAGT
jgi:hypothetical protein